MSLLNFQRYGNGQPLVMIHGLFGSLENLNMIAKPLSEHFDIINVDVRNHGHSFHNSAMDYDLLTSDLINLLDHLALDKVMLLGHSMGGKIAMNTALIAPNRIDKLVVADIAPVAYTPSHLTIIEGLSSINLAEINTRSQADKQLAPYVKELGVRQFLLKNLVFSENQATWRCNLKGIVENYPKLIAELNSSSQYLNPTLFIKGGNSNYITEEHRNKIVRLFPKSQARIMADCGHWLHAEKPSQFSQIVKNFIQS